MLAQLAIHYYRPDFTEGQAKSLILDMVTDLVDLPLQQIEDAMAAYRKTPPPPGKFKGFPASWQLIQIVANAAAERSKATRSPPSKTKLEFGDSRPILWWHLPRKIWRDHWHEDDIPQHERQTYFAIKTIREHEQHP